VPAVIPKKYFSNREYFSRYPGFRRLEEELTPMLFSKRPRTDEFEAAAMPHMNDIYRTAARLLGNGTGADDIVQDVYLQAWKSFDQFELGTNCRAWLFRILFHTLNHYRRKWLNIRMVRESDEILDQTPAASPALPEHITDEEMMAALAEVPQEFRAAVLLIDVEEFSYKETAGILNVPIGTVMSRLSRGRKVLREKLAGLAESYGIGGTHQEGKGA
jgi:RNA polymerase sigma-70 factor (ECF subfamily)